MYRLAALAAIGWALVSSPGWAQSSNSLADLYGEGVHLYNAGRHADALELFDRVIDAGTVDPRVYYYRGFTNFALGNDEAGVTDFEAGANLEAGDQATVLLVNQSLMRVQGSLRVQLERVRAEAKVTAVDRREQSIRRRYETLRDSEEGVLLRPPAANPLPPGADPFAEDPGSILGPRSNPRPAPGTPLAPLPELPPEPAPQPVSPIDPSMPADPVPAPEPAPAPADDFGDIPDPSRPAMPLEPAPAPAPADDFGDIPDPSRPAMPLEPAPAPSPADDFGDIPDPSRPAPADDFGDIPDPSRPAMPLEPAPAPAPAPQPEPSGDTDLFLPPGIAPPSNPAMPAEPAPAPAPAPEVDPSTAEALGGDYQPGLFGRILGAVTKPITGNMDAAATAIGEATGTGETTKPDFEGNGFDDGFGPQPGFPSDEAMEDEDGGLPKPDAEFDF